MSEFKLISPLLDNFAMGAPISDHHGVFCCPAMSNGSDKKYIVKILSIPASAAQLDAFLLTGAYKDEAEAMAYFEELSNGVVQEAEILKKLSRFEGFLPYEDYQVVPNEEGPGYLVYMLSPYKRSLARYLSKHGMTYLRAINLGLDLCAAMTICRRSGYLYVDLKPENIFITDDGEYRVGDLGFVNLNDLRYASLPDKYRSEYTAPEIQDAFSSINTTVDIYAIGLILYQVYNDGKLPPADLLEDEAIPAPAYADYEIAEIILKACARNPEDRWQDPVEMGQALVSYMQRNGANDVPIVPAQLAEDVEAPDAVSAEELSTEAETEPLIAIAADSNDYEQLQLNELKALLRESEDAFNDEDTSSEDVADVQDDPVETVPLDDPADLSFMSEMVDDETAPAEGMAEQIQYNELTDDTLDMLSQADELIAHETPEPVIQPEAIDVPMPAPIVIEPTEPVEDNALDDTDSVQDDTSEADTDEQTQPDIFDEENEEPIDEDDDLYDKPRSPIGKIIGIIITIILLAGLLAGTYFFLTEYYLQPITSISLSGHEDCLTVDIKTDVDEKLLTAICTDTYGNRFTSPVVDGKASFTGLSANTLYYINLDISGLHKLIGSTSSSYTTPQQTNIVSFSAIAGMDEGTVIIRFTVNGIDSDQWKILCSTDGEEDKVITTTEHSATISGLTVGKTYRFTLTSENTAFIVGTDSIEYTVVPLIFAENLTITSCENDSLTAEWKAPQDTVVESWSVRCYNENGYNKTLDVNDTKVTFTDLNCTQAYNVEVIAKGMTAGKRAYVTANSITVTSASAMSVDAQQLQVSWKYDGPDTINDWLLIYRIDGNTTQELIRSKTTTITLKDYVPGAIYHFQLQTENGNTVFNGTFTAEMPKAAQFEGYQVSAKNMTFKMCKTPTKENWTRQDVPAADYTNRFAANQKASFVIALNKAPAGSNNLITTLFVIRDADGNPVIHSTSTHTWTMMWYKQYCYLEIPTMPEQPGKYTIEIYFMGASVYAGEFEIIS